MLTIDLSHRTPNLTLRTIPPRVIVIHATAGGERSALAWLTARRSRVSADYVITKSGVVYMLNPSPDRYYTWHAGRSAWHGLEIAGTLNPVAIGIELVNANNCRDPYPQCQIDALTEIVRMLIKRYRISLDNIVRHVDVAPTRKTDPRCFPWREWRDTLEGGA